MQTNTLPIYDDSVNTTGCCPRFNPEGWDGAELHFENKPFVKASTRSLAHVPLNMGRVFSRVLGHIEDQGASDPHQTIVLSRDLSPWESEHLFAVTKPVADEEMTSLSGDFVTKVFEGSYQHARDWYSEMQALADKRGTPAKAVHFFYTTCPKCAKTYGKNHVIGVVQV